MTPLKTRTIAFLILILCAFKVSAQEFVAIDTVKWLCYYKYEFIEDSTNVKSQKFVNMLLQIGTHLSKYATQKAFFNDSLFLNNKFEEHYIKNGTITVYSKPGDSSLLAGYNIFKNYPTEGSIFFSAYSDSKFFKVIQPMQMTWKLEATKDSTISGFPCKLATTTFAGRKYMAWYSLQIPISDGPYKFSGLPGLIVKISDTQNQHRFTLTSLKKIDYIRPVVFSKQSHIDVTPQEYAKILRNHLISLLGKVQTNVTFNSDEGKTRSLQRVRQVNNFIERY